MSNHGANLKRNHKLAEWARTCTLGELAAILEEGYCSPTVRTSVGARVKEVLGEDGVRRINAESRAAGGKRLIALVELRRRPERWADLLGHVK